MSNASENKIEPEKIEVILATDCGSTTSKARLFRRIGNEYRYVTSGEAPTTVEAPFEDVTMGVRNAIREIEELTGSELMDGRGIVCPRDRDLGVDLYITTSSAGGGLQMMVAGVVGTMTAESARRAALGAGGIVMDVISVDDGRRPHEKIERMRHLRPDMILLAGGTDGGTLSHVVQIAELIASADPKPRLGTGFKMPIVYAGNKNARDFMHKLFAEEFSLKVVHNLRPVLELENVEPSRNAIHELFMEHVMSHAPGYDRLMKWTSLPIMPTPAGEGIMFQTVAKTYDANVIGVGLGGATTNIYSVYDGKFVRTVSANLGMSYSICNVLKEAGIKNIMRWLPFDVDENYVRDQLHNKMIRPTTIPHTIQDLLVEHAIAREALRLAFVHHKLLARPLLGVTRLRDMEDVFTTEQSISETYIDMLRVDWLGGTGGLLSHAPRRVQSALILIDGFQPEGVTKLVQDSVFMMPHLGVLSTAHSKAAMDIFEKDCLVRIGTCVAPRGKSQDGEKILRIEATKSDGSKIVEELESGVIRVIPLNESETADMTLTPSKGLDVGAGPGKSRRVTVQGGVVGVLMDGRGRPCAPSEDRGMATRKLLEWFRALDAYPNELRELCGG